MPPRQNLVSRLSALIVAPVVLSSAFVLPGQAPAAVPPYTLEERAAAIASPALVYVEVRSRGFLRKKDTGAALHSQALVVTARCSGFIVGAEGHVISSSHCVQQTADSVHRSAVGQYALRVSESQPANDQRDALIRDTLATTEFGGETPGSKPERTLYAQLFRGKGGLSAEPAIQGEVLEALPINDADIALLKLVQNGLPVGELSNQPVDTNTPMFLLAFGSDSGSDAFTVRTTPIKIVGRYGSKDPVTYELDADLGVVSHGGMVVDSNGRVVGMINADMSSKDKLNRLITNQEHIKKLLANANVSNALSPMDNSYRSALNDYFAGRYSEAIKKFDQILRTMPDHSLATTYRKQAADRLAIEGETDASTLPMWLYAMLIGLGVALVLCFVVIVWLVARRRSKPAAAPYGPYAPVSAMPVSGMPTSGMPTSGVPVSGGGQVTYGYPSTFGLGPNQEGLTVSPPVPVERGQDEMPFSFPEPLPPHDGTQNGRDANPWAQ